MESHQNAAAGHHAMTPRSAVPMRVLHETAPAEADHSWRLDRASPADQIQEGWNGTKSARAQNSDLVAGGKFCRAELRVCRGDSPNRGRLLMREGRPEGLHYFLAAGGVTLTL